MMVRFSRPSRALRLFYTGCLALMTMVSVAAGQEREPGFGEPGAETEAEAQPRFGWELAQGQAAPPAADSDPPAQQAAPPQKADAPAEAAPAGDDASAADAETQARSLLKDVLGGLLPTPGSGRLLPNPAFQELIPADENVGIRDSIDRLAPYVPAAAKLLRRAQDEAQAGRGDLALELLQQVLDSPEDSLIRTGDGQSLSIRTIANRLLGKLGPELLKAYRLKHEARARQLLQDAIALGDTASLVEAATRYFHTEAGYEAANRLGNLHLDRGEYGMAARWYLQLLETDCPERDDPVWRLKTAFVLQQTNNTDLIENLYNGEPVNQTVSIAGQQVNSAEWLEQVQDVEHLDARVLREWGMFYGSASRTGVAAGSDPLLIRRWAHPLTDYRLLRERIENSLADLTFMDRAALPAFFPTAVDGKVAYRTLRGIQVADVATGELLWQTREDVTAEMILAGQTPSTRYSTSFRQGIVFRGRSAAYSSSTPDRDALVNLLLRDAVYGLTSSDGQRLFVIEDHAILSRQQPGYWWGNDPNQNDRYRRDWATNKLVAYELDSGRPVWEVGGPAMGEDFDLPLAGHYFFGAPVIDGNTLYLVAEKGEEIRVVAVNVRTGQPEWSQLIAFCDATIDRDIGRRWWTAQVSVKDGVVVCPTTVGWLVAVDQLNHALLWAYRYTEPNSTERRHTGSRNRSMVPFTNLNENWAASAPIVSGNRVIYTPSEESKLICLSLLDGQRLWQKDKVNYLYVAGVFHDQVVLVGNQTVSALSLEDGKTQWNRSLDTSVDGRPSGRGVAVEDVYYLPLDSGQLWSLDLKSGEVRERNYLSPEQAPLGNLAMYAGTLLSLSPYGMSSYEQRDSVEAEIAARKEQNPEDPLALLLEARVLRLKHQHAQTLQLLDRVDLSNASAQQQADHHELLFATLASLIQQDPAGQGDLVERLESLAGRDEERAAARRLTVSHHLAAGALGEAWQVLLKTVDEPLPAEWLGDEVRVTPRRWIAGRLQEVWTAADARLRSEIDEVIVARAGGQSVEDSAAVEAFLRVFGFHPATVDLRMQLAKRYGATERFAEAEYHLFWLRDRFDAAVRGQAVAAYVELLVAAGLRVDAARQLAALEQSDGTLADGTPLAEFARTLRATHELPAQGQLEPLLWGDTTGLQVRRSGPDHSSRNIAALDVSAFDQPSLLEYRYDLSHASGRLTVSRAQDDAVYWSVPLQGGHSGNQQWSLTPLQSGHRILIVRDEMLFCVAPLQRRMLWKVRLGPQNAETSRYYRAWRRGELQEGAGLRSTAALSDPEYPGPLAAMTEDFCCVHARRGFRVIDLQDGHVRWSYLGAAPESRIVASRDYVYLIPANNAAVRVFRAVDGKPVPLELARTLLDKSIAFVGNHLLLLEKTSGFRLLGWNFDRVSLRLYDPFADQTLWTRELPKGIALTKLEDGSLFALYDQTRLARLVPETGQLEDFAEIPAKFLDTGGRVRLLQDRNNLYALIDGRGHHHHTYYSDVQTLPVSGMLLAFDRGDGALRWNRAVEGQNLIVNHLMHSPLLVFATSSYEQRAGIGISLLKLLVVDKLSGAVLVDDEVASSGLRSFDVSMSDRYVEIHTYTMRIRLMATDQKTAAVR